MNVKKFIYLNTLFFLMVVSCNDTDIPSFELDEVLSGVEVVFTNISNKSIPIGADGLDYSVELRIGFRRYKGHPIRIGLCVERPFKRQSISPGESVEKIVSFHLLRWEPELPEPFPKGIHRLAFYASGFIAKPAQVSLVVSQEEVISIFFTDFAWSPNSKEFLVLAKKSSIDSLLVVLDIQTSQISKIFGENGLSIYSFAWHPDAKSLVVFGTGERKRGLYIVPIEGRTWQHLPIKGSADAVAWSSDGKKILFPALIETDGFWAYEIQSERVTKISDMLSLPKASGGTLDPTISTNMLPLKSPNGYYKAIRQGRFMVILDEQENYIAQLTPNAVYKLWN